jgi:hypothetical protein
MLEHSILRPWTPGEVKDQFADGVGNRMTFNDRFAFHVQRLDRDLMPPPSDGRHRLNGSAETDRAALDPGSRP